MKVFLLLAILFFSISSFASLNEILAKPEHADCLEIYKTLSDVQINTTSTCGSCTDYLISGKLDQERLVVIDAHEQRYGYRGGYQIVTSCHVKYLN